MDNKRIVLIDGNSLVYRAFFALPTTLTTSSGQVTNAVYGFTSMLLKLLREEKPDAVIVAFDRAAPTFRHEAFADYKAHREATPDELISQLPLAKDVLKSLHIPIYEADGYEADDVLATLARAAEARGEDVTIVTGDRDAFQLVSPKVRIMTTRKGISDIVVYDRQAVIDRYGVPPEKVADLLGLKGDTSDNIPGVPGVGDKTAAKLIQQFGSLEGVYEHIDEVKGDKLRASLVAHKEQARLSKRLATLDESAPVPIDLSDVQLGEWDVADVRQLFAALEFDTLLERFLADQGETQADGGADDIFEVTCSRVETIDELMRIFSELGDETPLAVEIEGDVESVASIGAAAGAAPDRAYEVPGALLGEFAQLLSQRVARGCFLASHDMKSLLRLLEASLSPRAERLLDTSVAAYLLNPGETAHALETLLANHVGKRLGVSEEGTVPAHQRAAAVAVLVEPMLAALACNGLEDVFGKVEMPLVPVLARMERIGVGIDAEYLSELSAELAGQVAHLETQIYDLAGEEFNIGSPQQVGAVLFERLGLSGGRRTKTGYSTDAGVLGDLAAAHPICEKILRWRELTKLRSTYMDALPRLVNRKTGRVHTSFNQTVTSTGRLSSSNPNLQNIPVRTELGHRIRDAFMPGRPGDVLMVADYSQIELRILAHLSDDKALAKAFSEDGDIHVATASDVFEVPPQEVTPDLRRSAKTINFGLIYGMSAAGLAQQLGIARDEAQSYIDKYFARYPGVQSYVTKIIAAAYRDGYVTTLLGRRRWIPELKSGNIGVRNFGERTAVNSPIQGSAADIIKLAMVHLDRMILQEGLLTRMVLQVHDELVFEVPPIEEEHAARMVRTQMEGAYSLRVPLRVDLAVGANWGDAK